MTPTSSIYLPSLSLTENSVGPPMLASLENDRVPPHRHTVDRTQRTGYAFIQGGRAAKEAEHQASIDDSGWRR